MASGSSLVMEDTWVIKHPEGSEPTLEAQVKLTNTQQMKIDALKEELLKEKINNRQAQVEIDGYQAQLNLPKIYKNINISLAATDTAP